MDMERQQAQALALAPLAAAAFHPIKETDK